MVGVTDCSTCSINARVFASRTDPCAGELVLIDASTSFVTDCPGALSFTWTRNGEVVPDETTAYLTVTEEVAGEYEYAVTVSCDPPPVGLDCWHTSPAAVVTYEDATGMPEDLGNSLVVIKNGSHVDLSWAHDPGGMARSYELLRGLSKLELPLPGPAVVDSGLASPETSDLSALLREDTYFYRVRGVGCGDVVGPY
jgi:hypothetical protein